jgi:hypothetical protein
LHAFDRQLAMSRSHDCPLGRVHADLFTDVLWMLVFTGIMLLLPASRIRSKLMV